MTMFDHAVLLLGAAAALVLVATSDNLAAAAAPALEPSLSGVGNNVDRPMLGAARTEHVLEPELVGKGLAHDDPLLFQLPDPRVVSNELFDINIEPNENPRKLNDLHTAFGQFFAHDIMNSRPAGPMATPDSPFFIRVPKGDPFMDPLGTGNASIPFQESGAPVLNRQSSFVDASHVYGESAERLAALRKFAGRAHLLEFKVIGAPDSNPASHKMRLPTLEEIILEQGMSAASVIANTMENAAKTLDSKELYACGDFRCNNNPSLSVLHTVLLREHNRLAAQYVDNNPTMHVDEAFARARRLLIAKWQNIVFNEYVPLTLGTPLPKYKYNKAVDPEVKLFFSTVAFRYGHSEVNTATLLLGEDFTANDPPILLRDAFHNPRAWKPKQLDSILRGMARQVQRRVDTHYVRDLRNFLFRTQPPGSGGAAPVGGFDLAAFNIMRGREHGLPLYTDARRLFGLSVPTSFAEMSKSEDVAKILEDVYGSVDHVDAYVGALAEKHVDNANFGELIHKVLYQQYLNLRDGDRFYFENDDFDLTAEEKADARQTTLSKLIMANTEIKQFPCQAFRSDSNLCGPGGKPIGGGGGGDGGPSSTSNTVLSGENAFAAKVQCTSTELVVEWQISNDSTTVEFAIIAETDGYVAMGVSETGSMIGSDAIVFFIDENGKGHAIDSWLGGQTEAKPNTAFSKALSTNEFAAAAQANAASESDCGVCADAIIGGAQNVELISLTREDGKLTAHYRRPVIPADIAAGYDLPLEVDGEPYYMIAAIGSTNYASYHTEQCGAQINLKTGTVVVGFDLTGVKVAHGAVMATAALLLMPTGVFIGAFARKTLRAWWFRLHIGFLTAAALLIVLPGFVLAFHYVGSKSRLHFSKVHHITGFINLVMVVLTPLIGQAANVRWVPDRKYTPWFPDKLHWVFGYATILVSWLNVFLGLNAFGNSASVAFFLAFAYIILLLGLYMALKYYVVRTARQF